MKEEQRGNQLANRCDVLLLLLHSDWLATALLLICPHVTTQILFQNKLRLDLVSICYGLFEEYGLVAVGMGRSIFKRNIKFTFLELHSTFLVPTARFTKKVWLEDQIHRVRCRHWWNCRQWRKRSNSDNSLITGDMKYQTQSRSFHCVMTLKSGRCGWSGIFSVISNLMTSEAFIQVVSGELSHEPERLFDTLRDISDDS